MKIERKEVHGQLVDVQVFCFKTPKETVRYAFPKSQSTGTSWEMAMGNPINKNQINSGFMKNKRNLKVLICKDFNDGVPVAVLAEKYNKSENYIRVACGVAPWVY